jgi:hypothetical protein
MNRFIGTYAGVSRFNSLYDACSYKEATASMEDGFVIRRSVFQPCLELLYPEGMECCDDGENRQSSIDSILSTTISYAGLLRCENR